MSRVYVGNLSPRVTERDLEDEFRAFGVIRSVWVARRPPGYAFIDFDDSRDAEDAIRELDGKNGWRVELSHNSRGGGAIVLVDVHLDVVVFLLVDAALAGHHHHRTVDEKRCHMPMAMASGIGDEAEVEGCCIWLRTTLFKLGNALSIYCLIWLSSFLSYFELVSSGSALHCFIASALPCGFGLPQTIVAYLNLVKRIEELHQTLLAGTHICSTEVEVDLYHESNVLNYCTRDSNRPTLFLLA
ncbi:hypothetical protein F8388_015020 [Cannabis sativa]|uniref:RRM domain-containing protein n=1 Tax=Cannabis sativa TaxID=3483 RepID=A0A7J6EKP4_CANSA|nr:hypothetical protein F8388_015020 [Cannabis sativa]